MEVCKVRIILEKLALTSKQSILQRRFLTAQVRGIGLS